MRKTILVIAALVIAILLYQFAPLWVLQHNPFIGPNPKAAFGFDYEDVSFPAADGETLRGWFVPGRSGATAAIVTVHGAGGTRSQFMRELPMYHNAGYAVLLFDCRGQGLSDGHLTYTLGVLEGPDVASAAHYLRERRGFRRIGVVGCSQGGGSVILAAGTDSEIDAVIAEAPFAERVSALEHFLRVVHPAMPRWLVWLGAERVNLQIGGIGKPSPIDVVARIAPRPLLLIHGADDWVITPENSKALYQKAGEPKELWLPPFSQHCEFVTWCGNDYRQHVAEFLARYLPPGA